MPCWVAPSIAADLWKISVSEILERVKRGEMETKQEGPFTFVNIGERTKSAPRPPTFSIVTRAEQEALEAAMDITSIRLQAANTRRRPLAA